VGLTAVRVLGIDTATRTASIGICEDSTILAERTEKNVASHAALILPLIERVLAEGGVEVEQLDAIAVSAGPGSFTGLRIGMSIAKGLACATGAQVVGISTLEALARTVADRHGPIWTLLDARKGEIYAASFEGSEHGLRRTTDDVLTTPETLVAQMSGSCTVVGDVEARYGDLLKASVGPGLRFLPFDEFCPRGGVVAGLGVLAVREGRSVDPTRLEPAYIRLSDAERLHG